MYKWPYDRLTTEWPSQLTPRNQPFLDLPTATANYTEDNSDNNPAQAMSSATMDTGPYFQVPLETHSEFCHLQLQLSQPSETHILIYA